MAAEHNPVELEEGASKRERLGVRISPAQKALIERAAEMQGRSVSDFVVSSAQERAEQVIRTQTVLTLTLADMELFADLVLNPPAPAAAARSAAKRYKRRYSESS